MKKNNLFDVTQLGDIEEIKALKWNRHQRTLIVVVFLALFVWLNYSVISIIEMSSKIDTYMIINKIINPSERLVTDKVYISLVAATVAEVAGLLIVIMTYLFPKK